MGRFHSQYPDHLQVVIHEGGPRLTKALPELVWVMVTEAVSGDVFTGKILNPPKQLQSLKSGSAIKFIVPATGRYPILTTDKYLGERPHWRIHPCNKCGLSELFDVPTELFSVIFPQAKGEIEMFTSFCGVCGGTQGIERMNR
jgi:hypothetical protein